MRFNPGTVGTTLHFTSKIPADAAEALRARSGDHASFDLTPNWGEVPEITARSLARAGVPLPDHWDEGDVVIPINHGQAFYLGNIELGGGAASFSMKGVNLRTGRAETNGPVSDDPSQTYWAPGVPLPWIDGYVPSDGQAVRQFVPLKGEGEMGFDVARHVGISQSDRFIDAIRVRFFAPLEPKPTHTTRGGRLATLGSVALGSSTIDAPVFRGAARFAAPEVGMGAGARMRQVHEHNSKWKAGDFRTTPWFEAVFRMVWLDEWNELATLAGKQPLGTETIDSFAARQAEYESRVRQLLGIHPQVDTDVDLLPTAP